jgi:hypothetical protein
MSEYASRDESVLAEVELPDEKLVKMELDALSSLVAPGAVLDMH